MEEHAYPYGEKPEPQNDFAALHPENNTKIKDN